MSGYQEDEIIYSEGDYQVRSAAGRFFRVTTTAEVEGRSLQDYERIVVPAHAPDVAPPIYLEDWAKESRASSKRSAAYAHGGNLFRTKTAARAYMRAVGASGVLPEGRPIARADVRALRDWIRESAREEGDR